MCFFAVNNGLGINPYHFLIASWILIFMFIVIFSVYAYARFCFSSLVSFSYWRKNLKYLWLERLIFERKSFLYGSLGSSKCVAFIYFFDLEAPMIFVWPSLQFFSISCCFSFP